MVYNRRNITHKLILSLLIICMSISPIFAQTEHVEIVRNDNIDFHAYNSNTNVANSYIDSGATVFSQALNYMFMNIAKNTSTNYAAYGVLSNIYSKLSNSDTTLTNIATDVGLLKQGSTAQTNLLSSISSNSNAITGYTSQIATTLGGSTSGNIVDIKDSMSKINWLNSTSSYIGVYDPNGNLLQNNTTYSFTDYYVAFTGFHNDRDSITKINIPLSAWSSNPYVKSVSVYSGVATGRVSELYYFVETSSSNGINVYFTPSMPYSAVYIRVTVNGNFHTITPSLNYIQYLPNTSEDYFKLYDFIIQYNMLQKDVTIDGDVTVDTTNLENKIDDVIDTINNLSLQDNDVKLNLTINNNTGTDGTNIIGRLQNFFNTGVSVGDFFDNVDDAESGWFTQSNSDVINTLRGGYTNFYE